MSFFSRLFKMRKSEGNETEFSHEADAICAFERKVNKLLSEDKFISRKDYVPVVNEYSSLYSRLDILQESGTLAFFCDSRDIQYERAESFLELYEDLADKDGSSKVSAHNEKFISRHLVSDKTYFDNILKEADPAIRLDEQQRRVVLSDEDYTLVIAGAGAGKTTTVAAKVKYLVEKKHIRPDQILVISFTNKAVKELQDRINKALKIDCPVTTFHKAGYAVLRRQDNDRKTVVDQGFMFNVINNYLKGNILENPELVDKLILFFGSYFDAPFEGDDLNDFFNYVKKADFSTLKGNISEYAEQVIDRRTGKCISIAHEFLRSAQEVRIANFLYMNGIEYVYEKPYPYLFRHSYKQYTPDFTIEQDGKVAYIEHFGITEDGKNSRYSDTELERYKKAVNDKVRLHSKHNTDLVYTFSSYCDGRDILVHLQEELAKHGFELRPRSSREIFDKIVNTEENRYISRLVKLVCTFLRNFKTDGYEAEDFRKFRNSTRNERNRLFLSICEQCYYEYSRRLKEKNAIDFEDMINDSARILREGKAKGVKLDFKYVIVDEYQDISRQRFNLTKELSEICDAKIVAVGDDWQSIFAYAGSDISLFTDFRKAFGYGQELRITRTYRNAQELIDIAGGFIQRNCSQMRKALVSSKHIHNPVIIQTYTENVDRKKYEGRGGRFFLVGETVEKIMKEILSENPDSSILLLGRYGFDGFNLTKSSDFVYWEKSGRVSSRIFSDVEMDFMTVHRAKGLGYDNVIIINAMDAVYGFPSQVQDDPVLKFVVQDDHTIEYAEERRLFYVALTRTKNRVYIVTPQQRPSEFVRELLRDYPNVTLRGTLDEETDTPTNVKSCPVCGYPLQLRYRKSYGLKLWICSNEPEICDFMTNNLKGGSLSILKCDQCRDGYLIVKEGIGEPFLGCTNYKPDRTGCNRTLSKEAYIRFMKNL